MSERTQDHPDNHTPAKQRLWIRYAKRGTARFASHRDVARTFELAVNRAQIPVAYSSESVPRPRLCHAHAAATGAASEAEYLEVALTEVCDPDKVVAVLAAEMPSGMDILEAIEADRTDLADVLSASAWLIEPAGEVAGLDEAVEAVMAAQTVEVERMTESGLRPLDVRAALIGLDAADGKLLLMLRHVKPPVGPDDVLRALAQTCPALDVEASRVTRLAQGTCQEDASGVSTGLADPFTGEIATVW
ncbi:TIGR03936 family radical SAM-associated protein [Cutibacterium equinum]|uniref:TIGR03936 family radical SAM-associated protein n=1 Tax=Cutibacterium equinum TaxID=3016342 RepID=A0ABY7QZZ3_9ACTN|nr:TIGR03936 family radical SAM-associated protein [Cutibacterium equinum]WCC80619.1 TIGR03936 family radical SAM-associated protein [Cutibacterium equinum]